MKDAHEEEDDKTRDQVDPIGAGDILCDLQDEPEGLSEHHGAAGNQAYSEGSIATLNEAHAEGGNNSSASV
jgi:hypothetical protein